MTKHNQQTASLQSLIDSVRTITMKVNHEDFGNFAAETLAQGQSIRFQAHGQSMLPTIYNGDIITISPIEKHKLKTGGIVLYRNNVTNNLAAHRIIHITNLKSTRILYIRGDASGCSAEHLNEKNILGHVTYVEHNGLKRSIDNPIERLKGKLWALLQTLRKFCKTLIRQH